MVRIDCRWEVGAEHTFRSCFFMLHILKMGGNSIVERYWQKVVRVVSCDEV
jgi:hypothetical protein